MNTRPRPGQSDEDLIKENAEFLRLCKRKTSGDETTSSHEDEDLKRQKSDECGVDCIYMDPETILNHAKAPNLLLSDILEKSSSQQKVVAPPNASKQAFPQAFRRDKMISSTNPKLSVFASMQQKKYALTAPVSPNIPSAITVAQVAIKKTLGPSEAQRIHEENTKKLSEMSPDEILSEKQKLLESVDPTLLAFLKSRKAKSERPMVVDEPSQLKGGSLETEESKKQVAFELKQNEPGTPCEEPPVELPIDPEEARRWLHMDVVETEKLRWTARLPPPRPLAPGSVYPARFDFNGSLLPPEADLPVTLSLHHHGSEPERAGYTLEELLLFSRSSVTQQRVLGLGAIANVLRLVKEGRLDECLQESILPQLVGAGVFAMLRFSLDENVPQVLQAASEALAALLSSQPDEVCLALLLGTSYGVTQPTLGCPLEGETKEKGEEPLEERELRDHELLQLDVVRGALRTDLVPRVRYLLEVVRPGPRTVLSLLEVLARLARHSREVALEVASCPGLIATLCENFLPPTWDSTPHTPSEMSSVYKVPLAKNVRLLRVLAAQSKGLASDLVFKYPVVRSILAYLASEPSETGIPDGASLLLESMYLWQTLLGYGLTLSQLRDFSSVLGKLLHFHVSSPPLRKQGSFYQEHTVALISLIRTVVAIDNVSAELPRELLVGVGPTIVDLAATTLLQAASNDPLSPEVDSVHWLSLLERLIGSTLMPLLQSQSCREQFSRLRSHSGLLSSEVTSGRRRDPRGLPSLGSVTWGQPLTPSLQTSSPLPLLQPLVSFILTANRLHPQLAEKVTGLLLSTPGVCDYLSAISSPGCPGSDYWFSTWEVRLGCDLLEVTSQSPSPPLTSRTLQQAALNLLPCVRAEQKHLARKLLGTWVIAARGFSDEETLTSGLLGALHLGEVGEPSDLDLLRTAYNNLHILHASYEACLGLGQDAARTSCQSVPAEGQAMLPRDWPFLPLVLLAGRENQTQTSSSDSGLVRRCLQWVLLLETLRPSAASQMLSPTARFCRLACVFLAGSDVFLEPQIHSLVSAILQKILKGCAGNLDFDEKIPGLNAFWDLYLPLVKQYVAESYGDKTFAQFVLIPLQQKYEVAFRRHLWGEQAAAIRFLSLPPEELLVGVEGFLEPLETDPMLLASYLRSLRSGLARPEWSPLLYLQACHHVSQYCRRGSDSTLRKQLTAGLQSAQPELRALLD